MRSWARRPAPGFVGELERALQLGRREGPLRVGMVHAELDAPERFTRHVPHRLLAPGRSSGDARKNSPILS
jgi:hypothetical protein